MSFNIPKLCCYGFTRFTSEDMQMMTKRLRDLLGDFYYYRILFLNSLFVSPVIWSLQRHFEIPSKVQVFSLDASASITHHGSIFPFSIQRE